MKTKKIYSLLILCFLLISFNSFAKFSKSAYKGLDIKEEIFDRAYSGYLRIPNRRPGTLIIVDYSKPSNKKRFYVLDVINQKLLYKTYVAHGKNSGFENAYIFSDNPNSFQSSLGFYLCDVTYNGKYGYSLRLKGLEKGINANAEQRAIVIHGSENSEEKYLKKNGFLGRSLSCFVLPTSLTREIIDCIKNGAVLFAYADDQEYKEKTKFKLDSLEPLVFDESIPNYNYQLPTSDDNQEETQNKQDIQVESDELENVQLEKQTKPSLKILDKNFRY